MRSIDACNEKSWTVVTWDAADGGNPVVRPFTCRSWRHAGPCRQWCGSVDFARIAHALKRFHHWTYLVLTYPRRDYPDTDALFRAGKTHWHALAKRIRKIDKKFRYIQTWEVHKSMWPHVNVTVASRAFQDLMGAQPNHENPPLLRKLATASGFGKQCWAEPIRGAQAMAGYLTKLGMELTQSSVKDQTPVNAPPHFRRIRASRNTLPPREKNDTITGQLFNVPEGDILQSMNGSTGLDDPLRQVGPTFDFWEGTQ